MLSSRTFTTAFRSLFSSSLRFSSSEKTTTLKLIQMKRNEEKIAMLTAYDFPSALHAERANIDVVLCGDSVGMVVLGEETTQYVGMDAMIHHCQAVSRGLQRPLLVGDMPFGSYEVCRKEALRNAYRLVKEGRVDAVKLEGGKERAELVRSMVEGGVAVMGHVGLMPQAISVLGGFRAQGRTATKAMGILEDALRLQDAGVFAIVVECVPALVGQVLSEELEVPVIGIGSGPHTDGQVLVYHDLLGMQSHPHHEQFVPRFCKQYARVGDIVSRSLDAYREDVKGSVFPSDEFSPYKMSEAQKDEFKRRVRKLREEEVGERKRQKKTMLEKDEYAVEKLY